MVFTDKEARKLLNKVACEDLRADIEEYPEDERDGRTDMEMLAEEARYILDFYEEDGTLTNEDLREARRVLNVTNYGKRIPLYGDIDDMANFGRPLYTTWQIENAKSTVNEYNRLKRLVAKLDRMGF